MRVRVQGPAAARSAQTAGGAPLPAALRSSSTGGSIAAGRFLDNTCVDGSLSAILDILGKIFLFSIYVRMLYIILTDQSTYSRNR